MTDIYLATETYTILEHAQPYGNSVCQQPVCVSKALLGDLKMCSRRFIGKTVYVSLAIPNMKVRYIYKNKILAWFDQKIKEKDLMPLYRAVPQGNGKREVKSGKDKTYQNLRTTEETGLTDGTAILPNEADMPLTTLHR